MILLGAHKLAFVSRWEPAPPGLWYYWRRSQYEGGRDLFAVAGRARTTGTERSQAL